MLLGKVSLKVFPVTHTLEAANEHAGEILCVIGWLTALFMWGFGMVWLFFAVASVSRSKFPFNIRWWAFTFPLGVFSLSTLLMGNELPSVFLTVIGMVC